LRQKPRVIIATPGRLVDHLQQRTANLDRAEILVLDEADRMLDMGFAPQLTQILRYVPKKRQTLMFTATWDPSMDRLAKTYLQNPERIEIGTVSRAAASISQKLIQTTPRQKEELLLDELNRREGLILVFTRTQRRTDKVAHYLDSYGLEVGRIHGGRSQAQRTSALRDFKNGRTRILVATDIAARGIDVAEIAHVINFDIPMLAEDYIHRIGRTGRAGMTGEAVTFLTSEDRSDWSHIVRLLKKSGSTVPQAEAAAPSGSKHVKPAAPAAQPAADPAEVKAEQELDAQLGAMKPAKREFYKPDSEKREFGIRDFIRGEKRPFERREGSRFGKGSGGGHWKKDGERKSWGRPSFSKPREEGASFSERRSNNRFEGRSENKFEGRSENRAEGKSEFKPERRSEGFKPDFSRSRGGQDSRSPRPYGKSRGGFQRGFERKPERSFERSAEQGAAPAREFGGMGMVMKRKQTPGGFEQRQDRPSHGHARPHGSYAKRPTRSGHKHPAPR
jgi:superfamily II DNA/RNA helicase